MSEPFLIGEAMSGGYGKGPDILHDTTISVERGQIAVIVGPNGAGKSTGMKALFGMLDLRKGQVVLDGRDIGTVVCPNADVKIFVIANSEVRAQRRFAELQARGEPVHRDRRLAEDGQLDADGGQRLAEVNRPVIERPA